MRIFPMFGWMLLLGCCAGIDLLSLTDPDAVTGPETVTGPEGRSVSVMCHYKKGYEKYPKFWCRDNLLSCLGSHIIDTTGSEAEVWHDRFSIQDNHTQRTITVTVENLVMADTGTYLCGVARALRVDPTHPVYLLVSPEWTQMPPECSSPSSSTTPASPWTTAEKEHDFASHHTTPTGSADIPIYILVLCTLLVLILLLVAIAVLIFISRRKRKGSSVQMARKTNHSDLDSEKKDEIAYATVTISTPNQHAIYSNVEQLSKATGSASLPEETLYTTVKSKT
ncbi:CMRF35-like molecule 7 isoform X2 [Alligator mississippiensis]|uniref:CMRF35-like molecule 7 n=1 Tax=Alligator mississippiensis TaxID=8496 RepID=A0A151N394_ALLMI|nr:CMRF35-like molecule 7 isoform X2 [Alligator mississippiensis]KYO31095.1 CMRF35-like molecule 7 [Alligator mississippiensis]